MKMEQHDAQTGLRWHRDGPRGIKIALGGAKVAPKRPQDAPKTPQDGPDRPQDGSKGPQDGPKRPQDGSKMNPIGLIRAQAGVKIMSKSRIGDFKKTNIFLMFFNKHDLP